MKQGKQTCKILKDIRRQVAEANEIEFITSECQFQGDCLSTCPKCEEEVRYLEQQLAKKSAAGNTVKILGISASILCLGSLNSLGYSQDTVQKLDSTVTVTTDHETVAKKDTNTVINEKIFGMINEQMPYFSGGQKALMDYIKDNLQYPKTKEKISGRVIIQFVIEADGSISNVMVARGIDPDLDKEAVRVVQTMDKWNPGKQNGKPIRVKFTVPVIFKAQE